MNLFAKWQRRRQQKRSDKIVIEFLINHIENGGTLDDLFLLSVEEPVLWDQAGQYWFVKLNNEEDWPLAEPGRRLAFSSGRGGAEEEGIVAEDLGAGKYRVDFE